MPRIRDEDVALVRERARIDEVVREYVTLKPAGGGSLKGLCPFHDERTPSFHVTPARGFFHCFGCDKGGDVISFVQEIDHLGFAEAVERLADKAGVQLRYEEAGPGAAQAAQQREQRSRLVELHRDAASFYARQLAESADALAGRQFLDARGFDQEAAARFGVGYSPRDGEALVGYLRSLRAYADADLVASGLAGQGSYGLYDRFRGRLMWPVRDLMGDVVGFGARRLHDDDRIEAKYLNTPETSIYKKGSLLYGVDLAKRDIAKRSQAVVVEGYTDVMACHLAGVTTAVATCGTSFGDEHARVLRRLLMDQDELKGEIVFTFDGDEAGQKAALRAFEGDQRFVVQTYVAVEPDGLDPCDLRLRKGDAAVRDLVAQRQPLFRFALRTMLREHDLDSAEGRTRALERGIPVVARIRDASLRDEYARRLAGWVGAADPLEVVQRVRGASGGAPAGRRGRPQRAPEPPPQQQALGIPVHGDVDPATLAVEREALKVALQRPALAGEPFDELDAGAFRSPAYRSVAQAVAAAGGVGVAARDSGAAFLDGVLAACPDDGVRHLVRELAVEGVPAREEEVARYVTGTVARLQEMAVIRSIVSVKARLQRTDPTEDVAAYNRSFAELTALEARRQVLRARAAAGL